MIPTVVPTPAMTMLAMSQKPDLVLNILRSSTAMTRVSGIRSGVPRSARPLLSTVSTVSTVMAVAAFFLVGCQR